MVKVAPVRALRQSKINSPLVKAANKIVTSPSFNRIKSIDFDKKNEYVRFIKFIESSNKELLRIKLPDIGSIKKDGERSRGRGLNLRNLARLLRGARALTRRLKPFRRLSNLIPRKFRVKFKRWWRTKLRPFRELRRFVVSLPSKIGDWAKKTYDDIAIVIAKNVDRGMSVIKNLPNSKLFKTAMSQSKSLLDKADEAIKIGKEAVSNSKIFKLVAESSERIVKSTGAKVFGKTLKTIAGELSFGLIDIGIATYRFKQGDTTGGVLSLLAAIPAYGLAFDVVDIARDFGLFEEGAFLDKVDTFNLFRLNEGNPNKINSNTLKNEEDTNNNDNKNNKSSKRNMFEGIKNFFSFNKEENNDSNDETVVASGGDLVDNDFADLAMGHIDDQYFTAERETLLKEKQLITPINPEFIKNNPNFAFVNNGNTFLLPPSENTEQNITPTSGQSGLKVNTVVMEVNIAKLNSSISNELLQLKLDT